MPPDDVLQSQIEYYRARAPEFDEWYERVGMYDWGEEWNARWKAEISEVERAIEVFGVGGDVLDLACGTAIWGQRLAAAADSYVGVDASPEALDIARTRIAHGSLVHADLFAWDTNDRFDVVFMGFWLSHVPEVRFESFLERVGTWLKPRGRIFFVDNLKRPLPILEEGRFWQREIHPEGIATRNVRDGREFKIVKHYYEPDGLEARLASLGWSASVQHTEWFFYYGEGRRGPLD